MTYNNNNEIYTHTKDDSSYQIWTIILRTVLIMFKESIKTKRT